MAVDSLHDGMAFLLHVEVGDCTAVAPLVGLGHVLQSHPEVQLCNSKLHPWRNVLAVVVVACNVNVARAHVTRTVLVLVGREKPDVPQDVSGV